MTDKINFKLLKPFGSTLAKAELPLQLVSDFLKDLKQLHSVKKINFVKKFYRKIGKEQQYMRT